MSSQASFTQQELEIFDKKSRDLFEQAYCPYSKFPVIAFVKAHKKLNDSSFYSICKGFNIENASYPLSICAERTAISNAIIDGCFEITAVYVKSLHLNTIYPCGACLQVIYEFAASGDIKIYSGIDEFKTLKELLPYAFAKTDLNHRLQSC